MCVQKCDKEEHMARRFVSKPQNVNAIDKYVCDCEKEIPQSFPLDSHSARTTTVHRGKKYFAAVKR